MTKEEYCCFFSVSTLPYGSKLACTCKERCAFTNELFIELSKPEDYIRGHELPPCIVTFDGYELDYGHCEL